MFCKWENVTEHFFYCGTTITSKKIAPQPISPTDYLIFAPLIFFTLFSNFTRGIIISQLQPLHLILKSAPIRMVSHWALPQGCFFFNSKVSPISIFKGIFSLLSVLYFYYTIIVGKNKKGCKILDLPHFFSETSLFVVYCPNQRLDVSSTAFPSFREDGRVKIL